jgi:DNA (cytosine-5)-methyltransferase 1
MNSVASGASTPISHAGHIEQLVLGLGGLADYDPGRITPPRVNRYSYTVVIRKREETGLGARPIAISLFAGAGGLDLGVEAAGYQVAAANEIDDDAADTLEKNFVNSLISPVDRRSIIDVPTRDLLRASGLTGNERPELLVGGPPCTSFSKSGFWLDWKRNGLDPSASLLQMYTRVLREARPRAFILENVYALTFNNKASRPSYDRLLREIEEAGYAFTVGVLNAADYGVPQLRPRLFVLGVPKGKPLPRFPEPTHTGAWERRRTGASANGEPHISAGEAFEGLISDPEREEVLRGQYAGLLPGIPAGDNYLFYTAKRGHPDPQFEWRSRYWSFLLKLAPDRPSPTIQAQPGPNVGPFHWENRRLRVPELKRMFTYPDDFAFVGSRSSVQAQVGNSVPPLLAERVAEAVLASTHG